MSDLVCDYAIVGSGPGGGTLAARLAEGGANVILLEAGGDPRAEAPGLPDQYDVPAFHPFATENPAIAWDFFVRHYADDQQQARDPKLRPEGIYYPRAGTLGGCAAHNAMIFVCPQDADWRAIARLTGDRSWRPAAMRRLLPLLEECRHRPVWRLLGRLFGLGLTGHGWHGWLTTEHVNPREVFDDDRLLEMVLVSAYGVVAGPRLFKALWKLFRSQGDPNDRAVLRRAAAGIFYTPMTTRGHRRNGPRERLLAVQATHPHCLRIELDALATRVLIENGRAVGVEFLKGARLYRAHPAPASESGETRQVRARRGVILCAGAFNTPQLLMLSGVGPAAELRRHGIAVLRKLVGVGRNLQDRYEVSVVNRMAADWRALAGARFSAGDPLYREWASGTAGMYASNGVALAVSQRSAAGLAQPDLFCMGLLGDFRGYYPGYARAVVDRHDYFSWVVLKAHTRNRAGTVRLRSADPRDTPLVDFNYFSAADDPAGADLAATIAGLRLVRRLSQPLVEAGLIAAEEWPGPDVQTDAALAAHVRDTAWGHHASCSCAIGAEAEGGVLSSDFSVHGVAGLRVVDASVFPRIPGFFIASAVYMIAEKAASVILREYKTGQGSALDPLRA